MAYYFPEVPQTTYALNYRYTRPGRFKPKYYQIPSLIDQPAIMEPPRNFPIEPVAPIRHNPLQQATASGLGSKGVPSYRVWDPYGIVPPLSESCGRRAPSPPDIPPPTILGLPVVRGGELKLPIRANLDRNTAEKIYRQQVFQSAAARAMKDCAIPMTKPTPPTTTREPRPDMIRLLPQKYEPAPAHWQRIPLWDKLQPRRMEHVEEPNPAIQRAQRIREENAAKKAEQEERILTTFRKLSAEDQITSSHIFHLPGYLGFVPRWGTGQSMKKGEQRPVMTNVSLATHRQFPSREYHRQLYGRNAPMSKQLTLTYPYNPFNKIEEDTEFSAYYY